MEEKEEAATSLASNFRKMLKKFPGCIRPMCPILQRHCSSLPHRHPGPPSSLVPACQLGGSRHRAWLVYKARTGEKNLIFFWFSTERRAAVRSSYVTRWRPWFVFFCFDLFFGSLNRNRNWRRKKFRRRKMFRTLIWIFLTNKSKMDSLQ